MLIKIREAKPKDSQKSFEWANDREVIKNSLNRKKRVTQNTHNKWFQNYLKSKKKFIFICVLNKRSIGMVRLDFIQKKVNISYVIDTKERQKGLGFKMLKNVVDTFKKKNKGYSMHAKVKKKNISSNIIFHKLGFKRISLKNNRIFYQYKLKV